MLLRTCSYEFNKLNIQTCERKTHQENHKTQKYCLWLKVSEHQTAEEYSEKSVVARLV